MIDRLTERIRAAAAGKPGFGKSIRLDLGETGAIRIDGTGEAVTVDNAPEPEADATVILSAETLEGLMKGAVSAPVAVMTGKIKLRGESALALKLASFL
ncbi:MAG: SCP2 sterol-binding domain-containing protein [Pseudomonadota bacterium]